MNEIDDTPEGRLALLFVRNLASGEYEAARRLLVSEYARGVTAGQLEQEYLSMSSYGHGAAIEIKGATYMGPGDEAGDYGWVYVHVQGRDWLEGVTVMVNCDGDKHPLSLPSW